MNHRCYSVYRYRLHLPIVMFLALSFRGMCICILLAKGLVYRKICYLLIWVSLFLVVRPYEFYLVWCHVVWRESLISVPSKGKCMFVQCSVYSYIVYTLILYSNTYIHLTGVKWHLRWCFYRFWFISGMVSPELVFGTCAQKWHFVCFSIDFWSKHQSPSVNAVLEMIEKMSFSQWVGVAGYNRHHVHGIFDLKIWSSQTPLEAPLG